MIPKDLGGRSVPVSFALAFAVANEARAVVGVVTFEPDPGVIDVLLIHRDMRRDTEMSMIVVVIVLITHCLCFKRSELPGTMECDIYRDLWIKRLKEAVARVPDEDGECLVDIAILK